MVWYVKITRTQRNNKMNNEYMDDKNFVVQRQNSVKTSFHTRTEVVGTTLVMKNFVVKPLNLLHHRCSKCH